MKAKLANPQMRIQKGGKGETFSFVILSPSIEGNQIKVRSKKIEKFLDYTPRPPDGDRMGMIWIDMCRYNRLAETDYGATHLGIGEPMRRFIQ